jgi:hypothetical protein
VKLCSDRCRWSGKDGDEGVSARIVQNVRETVMSWLVVRSREATICSSEMARALAYGSADHGISQWRYFMPVVHAVVDALVADELFMLS